MIWFLTIWLDTAHLVSPIALAWSNAAARRRMLARWWKFVGLGLLVLIIPTWIGWNAPNLKDPWLALTISIYFWWNLFHFGAQNYGVCVMLGYRKCWQTDLAMIGTIAPGIWVYFGAKDLVLAGAAVSLAHWLTDIVLCSKASGRWRLFGAAVLLAGFGGFAFPALSSVYTNPFLVGMRNGLGFAHFLYSRWVWQRGRELLVIT
jgi:hypothetical protein